jgi:hypothetical protein
MEFKTVLSDRAASVRGRLSLLDQLYKEVALVRIFGLLLKAQSFATTTKSFFHLLAAFALQICTPHFSLWLRP